AIAGTKYADNNNKDVAVLKNAADIRGDKHFAPTEEDPDGNDLWFEYSFLYNDSLQYRDNPANLAEMRLFGFRSASNASNYRGFYYIYFLNDDGKGGAFNTSGDCPWAGHIDFSTYYPGSNPGQNCAIDLTSEGNTLNGKPIGRYIAGWGAGRDDAPYLWDSEYQTMGGWHRLGFHYHQEARIENGEVRYEGYTELFIDGVKCWKVLTNMEGYLKSGQWKDTDWSLKGKNLLLWTAAIDPNDNTKLVYTENDDVRVGLRLDNLASSSQSVFIGLDDIQWNCGDGFVHPVVRVENPKPVKFTVADGVEVDGAMYYTYAHDHDWDEEYTVTEEATVLENGTKIDHCKICGETRESVAAFVPKVFNPADLSNYEGDKSMLLLSKTLPQIAGDDHFYPTDATPAGKAVYFEFAILYNETMANSATDEFDLCLNYQGTGGRTLYVFVTKDNGTGWCKYSGGFDYSGKKAILYGPEGGDSQPKENYPNMGNYGWHMIGVKFYQTAALDGEGNVVYSGVSTLYVDGTKVWELDYDMTRLILKADGSKTLRLFDAKNEEGVLKYSDNPNAAKVRMQLRGEGILSSAAPMYFVYGQETWAIVSADFAPAYQPVADPAAATFQLSNTLEVPAAVYFEAKN
ncbi:MAG: hypothetical protein IKX66_02660, partial [Clostridia bacterium]|nr:hypothetical protein [Clostridia bacterium]